MNIQEYLKEAYNNDELKNICEVGCVDGGAYKHIYCSETIDFYEQFEDEIWELLYNIALDREIAVLDVIRSFSDSENIVDLEGLKNKLAWFAIERAAMIIIGNKEGAF